MCNCTFHGKLAKRLPELESRAVNTPEGYHFCCLALSGSRLRVKQEATLNSRTKIYSDRVLPTVDRFIQVLGPRPALRHPPMVAKLGNGRPTAH
jgi:hypothetical protein